MRTTAQPSRRCTPGFANPPTLMSTASTAASTRVPGRYEHLSPLDSVANNIARLSGLLRDERVWGLPSGNLVALTDPRSTDDIEEALLAAGRAAEDTLIFYFAGHGLLEYPSARLCLALGGAVDH